MTTLTETTPAAPVAPPQATSPPPTDGAGASLLNRPLKLSISLDDIHHLHDSAMPCTAVTLEEGPDSAPDTRSPTTAPASDEERTPDDDEPAPRAPWSETPQADAAPSAEGQGEGEEEGDAPDTCTSGSKSAIRKQAWTSDEDTKLLELVERHGPSNWSRIAAELPSRIGKQCRERWHNHLSPTVKKEVSDGRSPPRRAAPLHLSRGRSSRPRERPHARIMPHAACPRSPPPQRRGGRS
jgi:hypothetical protein